MYQTGNYADLQIWSAVEPSIGLVCACLPSMRHLLKLATSPFSRSKTVSSRRGYAPPTPLGSSATPYRRPHRGGVGRDSLEDGLTMGDFRKLEGSQGQSPEREDNAAAINHSGASCKAVKLEDRTNVMEREAMMGKMGAGRNAILVQNEISVTGR